MPRRRGVRLHERLEQRFHALRRDADARVAHFEAHQRTAIANPRRGQRNIHLPVMRELDGIAHEIEQALPDTLRIAHRHARHIPLHVDGELQALGLRLIVDGRDDIVHDTAQVHRDGFDVELARLDLREIENVVDHREQRLRARMNGFGVFTLICNERSVEQQRRHAEDAVHRRADLVTHVGEERALRLVRALRFFGRAHQRILRQSRFRHVLHVAGYASKRSAIVG